jgi:hypothetical protein
MKKIALFGIAFGYVWRVKQVRSRVRQKRRARGASAMREEPMQPMYIPMQQRPVARRSGSRASLHVADDRDIPRSRRRAQ